MSNIHAVSLLRPIATGKVREVLAGFAVSGTYTYEACKPGVKNLIVGFGIRDTARALKIGINTIIRT